MSKIKEIIHNLETGEITEIAFTAKELTEYEAKIAKAVAQAEAEAAEQIAAKADAEAKLAALGLTAEDLKALLG